MLFLRTPAAEACMRIFQETIARVRGDRLVERAISREGNHLLISGSRFDLAKFDMVFVVSIGKASCSMARPVLRLLSDRTVHALAVTKHAHTETVEGLRVLEASHPLPDETSVAAGMEVLDICRRARSTDLVIVLLSGGASSLVEVPAPGIDVRDIRMITQSLLAAGADIHELNAVRSGLSEIKAGGLARACGEATLVCLLLSDVIGNDRSVIGSAPCWGAPAGGQEALAILDKYLVPVQDSIRERLSTLPSLPPVEPEHHVVGDIYTLLEEAEASALALGLRPKWYHRPFQGNVGEVAAVMTAEALELSRSDSPHDCFIAAGESTVRVRGSGKGGRNQELACRIAIGIAEFNDLAVLSAGTDGTDGPTDAAGGLVDGDSFRLTEFREALSTNDSYHALVEANALLETGPTGTNLNDLVIIVRSPK